MQWKPLGNSGISISAIGQGTMGIGGYFQRDESRDLEWVELLQYGIDLGMSLIDTAEVYGAGHAEELVGEAIQGRRDRAFVATKFSPENSGFDAVIRAAEASLKRLRTDYIDLYQTHWSNPRVPIAETMAAMEKLVQDGKVRHIGLSNYSLGETRKAQASLAHVSLVSTQQEYNLAERTIEQQILPLCAAEALTLIAYSPLSQGKIAAPDDRNLTLAKLADKYGVTTAQLVLNWLLQVPTLVVIPKASSRDHLQANATACDFHLEPEDWQLIADLYQPQIEAIPTDRIEVATDAQRNVYRTLEEAIANPFNLTPSPADLAEQFLAGEILKPIKLQRDPTHPDQPRYRLIEGRVKYWGWVIAHRGEKPIPALVESVGATVLG